jgi:pyruvate dehydrogenase E2 component (dihydrolipoamide acetyltransferase)
MMEAAGLKGTVEIVEPTRSERAIARRSAETRATVPDLELSVDVDAGRCTALVDGSIAPVVVRAVALALRDHPRANAAYRDGRFELYSRVNVGVVLALDDELVIATVFDADRKGLPELAGEIASLRERAAELTAGERSGATFTVWHADSVTRASPLIATPHAGALCAGEVRDEVVVRGGAIVPGYVMSLTLACDHRILYGTHATGFMARIRELLERAEL